MPRPYRVKRQCNPWPGSVQSAVTGSQGCEGSQAGSEGFLPGRSFPYDEIAITRVALNRVFHMLVSGTTPGPDPQPLAPGDYNRLVALVFQGSGTISRLIRIKHDLARLHPDVFSDTFSDAINEALDELSAEWGREL